MGNLAITGGKAVRPKSGKWATWPQSDEADAKLMAEVTRSNNWSYDGKYEWDFAVRMNKPIRTVDISAPHTTHTADITIPAYPHFPKAFPKEQS
mgnify:CR=1 FL=1